MARDVAGELIRSARANIEAGALQRAAADLLNAAMYASSSEDLQAIQRLLAELRKAETRAKEGEEERLRERLRRRRGRILLAASIGIGGCVYMVIRLLCAGVPSLQFLTSCGTEGGLAWALGFSALAYVVLLCGLGMVGRRAGGPINTNWKRKRQPPKKAFKCPHCGMLLTFYGEAVGTKKPQRGTCSYCGRGFDTAWDRCFLIALAVGGLILLLLHWLGVRFF